jgi:transposase
MPSFPLCLLPGPLTIDEVLPSADRVKILSRPLCECAPCPDCGIVSRRIHSHRSRVLRDLPWQGRPVSLHVRSRRFRCSTPSCARRTFTERLGDVARVNARCTERVRILHRCIGLAVGGEAGTRLVQKLAIPISADTLLRAAREVASEAKPPPTPRVLGVDDWAWRKGHRYGTILVDLECNEVVELLPDRKADTLSTWLEQHPGVEIIARDRASAYAEGARNGAPDAIQVADRWHMLRSLGEALRRAVERHQGIARQVALEMTAVPPAADPSTESDVGQPVAPAVPAPETAVQTKREADFIEATRLSKAGASISRISRLLGVDRKTLRHWLQAGAIPSWRQPPRSRMIDGHLSYIEKRWADGCRNATLLWRELTALGFQGRYTVVKTWVAQRRGADMKAASTPAESSAWALPSVSRTARLLLAGDAAANTTDATFVAGLLAKVPALADTAAAARRLALLLRHKSEEMLIDVLDAAGATMLKPFITELRKDIGAVQAALDLPWTTSPVEGQISRLKMLKRTMYGRAGFALLRARVLHAE